MTGEPPRHESPYPTSDIERRLGVIEGWRGTVDEWRHGIDVWRGLVEREGLPTSVAIIGMKLDHLTGAVSDVRETITAIDSRLAELEEARAVHRGVVISGRSAALIAAGAAGIATVVDLITRLFP